MNLEGMKVGVVGGAVGGAAAALLLARADAHVTVFERVPVLRAVGAGIALQPNGLAVLYGLGLEAPLRRHGCVLESPRIADAGGRTLLRPALPKDPGGLDHLLMIRRSDLHDALHDALEARANVTLRLGAEVVAASADGRVEVRDGAGVEHHAFDLVVGADGVRSRLRDAGRFGAKVRPSGISYVHGLSAFEGARNEEAWTSIGIFGSFPVPGGTYWFCSMGHPLLREAVASRDLEAFRAVWRGAYPASGPLLDGVTRFDELLVNEVVRVDCDTFVDGRLALVGDAAHAMAPNLGQGANSALVDAAVLLDELRRTSDPEAALRGYDRRRRPAVRWVQDAAATSGRLSEGTNAAFRWMRDRVLMPLASAGGDGRTRRALQEPPDTLRRIASGA